jgi:hypothetical protein
MRVSGPESTFLFKMNSMETGVRTHNKVKVKFTLEQAAKAQRGSRGINLLFL